MPTEEEILERIAKAEEDSLLWAEDRVRTAEEGYLLDLGIPEMRYHIHPRTKTLTIEDERTLNSSLWILHQKVARTFNGIGWKVEPGSKLT